MTDPDTAPNPEPGTSPPTGKGPTGSQSVLILMSVVFLLVVACFGAVSSNRLDLALLCALLIATISSFGLITWLSGLD